MSVTYYVSCSVRHLTMWFCSCFFMARRVIPMIAFPQVRCMFIGLSTLHINLKRFEALQVCVGVALEVMRINRVHTQYHHAHNITMVAIVTI